jgi:uncharacterized protein YpuA (DUF1002 family)
MRRRLAAMALVATCTLCVVAAPAGAVTRVVTVGQNLTPAERARVLHYFGVSGLRVRILVVSNRQEHQLLDGIAPAREIGTRAISSAYVIPQRIGFGIRVHTHNITWVTPGMYRNALATAGVSNATVQVAAPFPVSGTAALAGIMWAYQAATGRAIQPSQQRTAAEEMVVTSQIAHATGRVGATVRLMAEVKQEVVAKHFTTAAQIRPVVLRIAGQLNLRLTVAQVDSITAVMERVAELHLAPSVLATQVGGIGNEAVQLATWWQRVLAFLTWLWARITGVVGTVDGHAAHSLDSIRYRP